MDIDLDKMSLRELQKESARALLTQDGTSVGISRYNKKAHHNSQLWYKAFLEEYIEKYGGLPRDAGPSKGIILFSEKLENKNELLENLRNLDKNKN